MADGSWLTAHGLQLVVNSQRQQLSSIAQSQSPKPRARGLESVIPLAV